MKNKPTEKQKEVLDIKNESVIVSASAGSGKTTIMIEKVLRLIRDDCVDVKNILVITFTNAAASEMKQKLINELNDAIIIEKDDNRKMWLIEQAEKVEGANICTIDKFCGTLVKKYFYNVGVSPNYQIMSSEAGQILKDRIFDKLLIEELAKKDDIFNLCDMLAKKRTSSQLKKIVFDFCEFLLVQADVDKYLNDIALKCYALPIEENVCFNALCEFINREIRQMSSKLSFALSCITQSDKLKEYISYLYNIVNNISGVSDESKRNFLFDIDVSMFPSKARKNKSMTASELNALEIANSVQEKLKKSIDIYKGLLVTHSKVEMEKCLSKAEYMIKLLADFSNKFLNRLEKEKIKINQFEFSDITHFAISILKNEDIHNDVLDEIKCVFVDEFQDVNELQYTLIKLLSKQDNLFLVGDVKQSIYGFRLCDPEIFLEIYNDYKLNDKYKKAKELNENFRSDKYILEFVNDVFCAVMTKENCGFEYAESSKLVANKEFECDEKINKVSVVALTNAKKQDKDEVEVKQKAEVYSVMNDDAVNNETIKNAYLEAEVVAQKVEEFLSCKIYDNGFRDVKFSDIAILFRGRNAVYKAVKEKLLSCGVNVICESNEDLNEELEIKYFHSILRVINNPYDDISLMTVLNFFTGITYDELVEERLSSDKKHFYESVLESENEKIRAVLDKIESLRQKSKVLDVYALALEVDSEFSLSTMFLALPDGLSRKENFDSVITSLAKDGLSLYEYIYFNDNCENKKNKTASVSEDGIVMSTIHSSKGLEYPIVILAGAGKNINESEKELVSYLKDEGVCAASFDQDKRRRKDTVALTYANFIKRKEELNEELRLLYVALTRAKNHLCIIGEVSNKAFEDLSYNVFESQSYMKMILSSLSENQLTTLTDGGKVNTKWASFELLSKGDIQVATLDDSDIVVFGKPNDKLTKEIERYLSFNYAFSASNEVARKNTVTALNSSVKSEDKKINYKLNSYQEENEGIKASELGSIYHKILETVDFSLVNSKEDLSALVKGFTEEELKFVNLDNVYMVIKKLKLLMNEKTILHKEKQFLLFAPYNELFVDSSVSDEILIQGVVDLIIENEDDVIIVDYKATREKRDWVLKERYKTQLQLYKAAVENAFNKKCSSTKIFSIFGGILIDMD